MIARNGRTGGVLSGNLARAASFPSRLRGLLGREGLDPGEGLWIAPCGAVHTALMRFPVDVVFLDRRCRVAGLRRGLPPWRIAFARGGASALELPAGTIDATGTAEGDPVEFDDGGE